MHGLLALCICVFSSLLSSFLSFFFFFNDPATTEIYTLSLHDALPISLLSAGNGTFSRIARRWSRLPWKNSQSVRRSEEHTSELQSPYDLVCRLLLEKKKKTNKIHNTHHDTRKPQQKNATRHHLLKPAL